MRIIVWYIVIVSIITFIVFGIDKFRAMRHEHRVPERTLFSLAAVGGSVGALLGMLLWRHKTRHRSFTVGVPAIIMAQVAVVLWFVADKY